MNNLIWLADISNVFGESLNPIISRKVHYNGDNNVLETIPKQAFLSEGEKVEKCSL